MAVSTTAEQGAVTAETTATDAQAGDRLATVRRVLGIPVSRKAMQRHRKVLTSFALLTLAFGVILTIVALAYFRVEESRDASQASLQEMRSAVDYLGGVISGSLHGWGWLAFGFLGSWLGGLILLKSPATQPDR